jgi:hypothetical protein
MFDLETINLRNQKAVDKSLRNEQVLTRSTYRDADSLVDALYAELKIELVLGHNAAVMKVCERITDIALECAPQAYKALIEAAAKEAGNHA